MITTTLRKISEYTARGVSPKYVETDGLLVLNQKCVRNQKISLSPARQTDKNKKFTSDKKLKLHDILINSTGVGTLGRVAQLSKELDATVDSHITIFRSLDYSEALGIKICKKYIGYAIREKENEIEALGKGATGQTELSKDSILDGIKIKIPNEFEEQNKIASVLSAYDDLIENNEKRIKILEEMAQLLYGEWFVKFKFPGWEKVKMVDSGSEFGLIPEGWEVKKLGAIAKEIRDSIDPKILDHETPYVGLEHIPRKNISLSDWGRASDVNSSKLKFSAGDILFGKIRPYFHKVVSAPIQGISSSDTVIIRANKNECQALILMCVSNESFVSYATNNSHGTKMPRADWKSMSKYLMVIPDEKTLCDFSLRVNEVIKYINILMFQNRKLFQLRDLLIPELVSGKRELK